jgi:hypothetical protein
VVGEDFAMASKVVLFYGGGGVGGFRVEEAGELGDKGISLWRVLAKAVVSVVQC